MDIIQRYLLCVLICYSIEPLQSQIISFGIPETKNYTREAFDGGTQTWDFDSDNLNRILAANNEGLLVFDGHRWNKYYLPNRTIVRSLAYDQSSGRAYVGGQDELGYFQYHDNRDVIFHDLKPTLPLDNDRLEDIWNIIYHKDLLYFRSLNKVYIYNGTKWDIIHTNRCTSIALAGDSILYNDTSTGLYSVYNGSTSFIKGSEILIRKEVLNVIKLSNSILVLTEKDGIYQYKDNIWSLFKSNANDYVLSHQVHSSCSINDSTLAIGTYLGGVVIVDSKGNIVKKIDKENGLQNNTIASLYCSPNRQLWIGTYNGIDMINLNGSFSKINPDDKLQGSVYGAIIYNDTLYCGTENGLYYRTLNQPLLNNPPNNGFNLVNGTKGQVWGLNEIGNDLIMCHNDGAFMITAAGAKKISSVPGAWKFLMTEHPDYVIGGFYTGIYLFKNINGIWTEMGKIQGFDESARIVEKDESYFWVSHPYRGLFRLLIDYDSLKASYETFGELSGLPSNLRNHVFKIKNKIVVAAEKGLYQFDNTTQLFSPFTITSNNSILPADQTYKSIIQKGNQIWYANQNYGGNFIIDENDTLLEHNIIHNTHNILLPGFEVIYPVGNDEALFLSTKGIRHFYRHSNDSLSFLPYISKMLDVKNQDLVYQTQHNMEVQVIDKPFIYTSNDFLIEFASTYCNENVKYRYYLAPIQSEWSQWDTKSFKEFNNLQPDKYTLYYQAINDNGIITQPYQLNFEIFPPWYKTMWARICYLLVLLTILWYSRQRLVNKYEQVTIDLEEQKNESDAKVLQLQNEKLETEIQFKNKELGLSTMHLVQKNETILKLKSELERIYKKGSEQEIKQEVKKLISLLSDDERLDDDWEQFSQTFDAVHNDFLYKIKALHPNLSPRDLKLCAYLRLNLTTKEIAPLMNISIRGVEISRYRLRKKLDLDKDVNLNEYMMGI